MNILRLTFAIALASGVAAIVIYTNGLLFQRMLSHLIMFHLYMFVNTIDKCNKNLFRIFILKMGQFNSQMKILRHYKIYNLILKNVWWVRLWYLFSELLHLLHIVSSLFFFLFFHYSFFMEVLSVLFTSQ